MTEHERCWVQGWGDALAAGFQPCHIVDEPERFASTMRAWQHGWNSGVRHADEGGWRHRSVFDAYKAFSPLGRELARGQS